MTTSQPNPRLTRWEHHSEWPLAAVAVVFLVTYSLQVLAEPRGVAGAVLNTVMTVLWVTFVVDYVVRFALAEARARWFVRHLFDLATVALPFLRPLRVLRLVVLVFTLQRAFGNALRGRVVVYATAVATLLVYASSLAVLDVERGAPDANITSFGDALWWSLATITTVGYGDQYPVTVVGRLIAALLMVGGISLIGVITATVASWIVQRVSEDNTASNSATADQIEALRDEVRQLSEALAVTGDRRTPSHGTRSYRSEGSRRSR
ncbi:potassium channel family protein [Mycolicibacterium aichiense]|uniref:Voltage-gated potassium channel n=1 Tax=Mycolicibacterium aichiense TaxID=1799 RepID=A0AAD1HML7_9MYCO|nr:potassium channel family protein [Mycolicibacterium aichiense]MCV7019534.1 potassium channel family protein [Mycolicibacterium aichiense]BBX08155.1 voltage-gated potassium channel [Mycolicibacterium aichiense]STZ81960.1 ion transport protein [Mycolicibacterium aichiense]